MWQQRRQWWPTTLESHQHNLKMKTLQLFGIWRWLEYKVEVCMNSWEDEKTARKKTRTHTQRERGEAHEITQEKLFVIHFQEFVSDAQCNGKQAKWHLDIYCCTAGLHGFFVTITSLSVFWFHSAFTEACALCVVHVVTSLVLGMSLSAKCFELNLCDLCL